VDGCIIDEVLLTIVIKYMQQDAKIQKCLLKINTWFYFYTIIIITKNRTSYVYTNGSCQKLNTIYDIPLCQ
jgi:hypothetical protein